jgi:hypothetical protein
MFIVYSIQSQRAELMVPKEGRLLVRVGLIEVVGGYDATYCL